MWYAVGGVLFIITAASDYRLFERLAYAIYGVGIVLLDRGAHRRQDGQGLVALARLRAVRHPAVGAGEDRGHHGAVEAVRRRPDGSGAAAVALPVLGAGADGAADAAHHEAARSRHRAHPVSHRDDDLDGRVAAAAREAVDARRRAARRHRVLPVQAARVSEEAPAHVHRSVARSVGRRLARAAGDLRRRQRALDRQGLAARHAESAAVSARALDRLSRSRCSPRSGASSAARS